MKNILKIFTTATINITQNNGKTKQTSKSDKLHNLIGRSKKYTDRIVYAKPN